MDTDAINRARHQEQLRAAYPEDRLARTLELSAFVRGLAWGGAVLHAGHLGTVGVVDRFLRQLYGPEFAAWAVSRLAVPRERE